MKVFYHLGNDWGWTPTRLPTEPDLLALSYNNWDDYGISTTFNAALYLEGKRFLEFSLKLMIENDKFSPRKLNDLRERGWDGFFPIPDVNYISVPSDIDFYNALLAKLDLNTAKHVLEMIRDAGYLINVLDNQAATALAAHEDFLTSPLREAGARKAFQDGWRLFNEQPSTIQDFTLNILNKTGSVEPVNFRFNSDHLPYDINVLIGQNGVGKSFTLKSLVEYWLGVKSGSKEALKGNNHTPFVNYPNLSRLILISYSPFEEFTIDLSDTNLIDKEAYKYFGFRKLIDNPDGTHRIGISRNLPSVDSVQSLLKALSDDRKFAFMKNYKSKFETIVSVLRPAIGFDLIAFEKSDEKEDSADLFDIPEFKDEKGVSYIPINPEVSRTVEDWEVDFARYINAQEGAIFFKNNKKLQISSGQRLFCYIVVNVVGQIRKDSLIIIDEPELFLHPTLEIEFIFLLKKVLKAFNSKAILATHSLAIAREIPANCIHVYRNRDDAIEIDHPPFETFGGDMQRISSYVFWRQLDHQAV